MEKDDPWECLDVDDSDLQSLVRPSTLLPSKRPLQISDTHVEKTGNPEPLSLHSTPSTQLPSLEPCSQRVRASFLQAERRREENPNRSFQNSVGNKEKSAEDTESEEVRGQGTHGLGNRVRFRHWIAGPAGAVQLAMQRDNELGGDRSCYRQDGASFDLMGCQEDEDFKKSPWVRAMDIIEKQQFQSGGNGDSRTVSIKFINSITRKVDRLPQVVGIIISCTPNGNGHMFVTLKDPTGTIDASVHRKVLEEDKFGKYLSVGSVIILRQVISKECCSAGEMDSSARTYVCGNRETMAAMSASQDVTTTGNAQLNEESRGQQVPHGESETAHVVRREIPTEKLYIVNMLHCQSKVPQESHTSIQAIAGNLGPFTNGTENRITDVKKLIGTSLAEWTDEQIDELFNNCEDIF